MLLAVMPAAACVSIGPSATLAASAPVFSPEAFFAGHTIGDGTLRVILSRSRPVHVVGNGRVTPDGTLVLTQHLQERTRPPRTRTWQLRRLDNGRFAVSLSDATGPVETDVAGNRLHLRFHARGGLEIEQWVYLQPDGQTALNRLVVRKVGLPVAALRETIRRVPQ